MTRTRAATIFVGVFLMTTAPLLADDALEKAWADREAHLQEAIAAYEKASKAPDAPAIVFERLARAHFFHASERLKAGSDEQYKEYRAAVEDGLRGLSRATKKKLEDAGDLDDARASVQKGEVGILYWTAVSYGSQIEDLSIFRQAGAAKRFKRLVERCEALDPSYFFGAPHRALAGFLQQAPGIMGGDSKKAREEADAAIAAAPDFADNYNVRAENVWLPEKDRAKYEADLAKALALADDACGPDAAPEQRAAKKHAAEMKAKAGEKF